MENATKALLIAASVLIAIILISLVMIVLNRASEVDTSQSLTSAEIAAINSKFEMYVGVQKGGTVRTLLEYAMDQNEYLDGGRDINQGINIRSNVEELINAYPNIAGWKSALTDRSYGLRYTSNITKLRNIINLNKKYKIWYTYINGLVHEIHIDNPDT